MGCGGTKVILEKLVGINKKGGADYFKYKELEI